MKEIETAAAPHISAFLERLDDAFRRFGVATGMPPRVQEAVEATPRHLFVHRFREEKDGPLLDFDVDPIGLLPLIYRGQPLIHVDASGAPLSSTNSESAYVLWLVHRLGIQPGERVLEIGSGSGWLLATMAHLVGSEGEAIGIEVIPDLAEQSRFDLAALGRENAKIVTADATRGSIPGGPFDRVIVTAATWDLPANLFELVADGGHLLVPLRLPGEEACEVTLLSRKGSSFIAETSAPGWFVPLVGSRQAPMVERVRLDAVPFWNEIGPAPSLSFPLWLGSFEKNQPGPAALPFRRYLALTEPSFAVFAPDGSMPGAGRRKTDFGLIDFSKRSIAIFRSGRILGFGSNEAAGRFVSAYRRWTELGMPGPAAYRLTVVPAASAPVGGDKCFIEHRGDSVLVRQLDPEAGAWRTLGAA